VSPEGQRGGPRLLAAGLLALSSLAFGVGAAVSSVELETAAPAPLPRQSKPVAEDHRATADDPEDVWSSEVPAPGGPLAPEAGLPGPALPSQVEVPSVGISASLDPVGVDEQRRIVVPPPDRAGWFEGRAVPGEVGPAVLVGHVDSFEGPAAFHGLDRVTAGDVIVVTDVTGSRVAFEVTRVEVVPKDAFPTDKVYGPVDRPEIRVITCGGPFDRAARSYRDNVIVSGVITRAEPSDAI